MNTLLTLILVLSMAIAVESHFVTPFMPRFPMMPMGFHPMMRPFRRRVVALPMNSPFAGGLPGVMPGGMPGGMGVLGGGVMGAPGVAGTTLVNSDNIDNAVISLSNGGIMGRQFINTDNSVLAVANGGLVGGNRVVYTGDAPDPDITVIG